MKKNNFVVLILIITLIEIKADTNNTNVCTLTSRPSADPYPSLLKCYKYNNDACCLSVHDDYIETYINQIFSPACVRKYPLFEILMCLGCHPSEYKYLNITENKKIIYVCRSFAEELWGGDLNSPSTVFDQCGFKVETEFLTKGKFENRSFLIPSYEFKNFSDFFEYIRIPYYEDFTIEIKDETDEFCYNNVLNLENKFFFVKFVLFFFLFLFE